MMPISTCQRRDVLPGGEDRIMKTRWYLRNVLSLAREVRVRLRDQGVVVATVLPGASPHAVAFRILPWGTTSIVTVQLEQILRAAPVRRMTWRRQRTICASQFARAIGKLARNDERAAAYWQSRPTGP